MESTFFLIVGWINNLGYQKPCFLAFALIGTQTEVEIRKEVMNMDEIIKRPCQKHNGYAQMLSGSSREGFRFKSSDQDTMIWRTYNEVGCY